MSVLLRFNSAHGFGTSPFVGEETYTPSLCHIGLSQQGSVSSSSLYLKPHHMSGNSQCITTTNYNSEYVKLLIMNKITTIPFDICDCGRVAHVILCCRFHQNVFLLFYFPCVVLSPLYMRLYQTVQVRDFYFDGHTTTSCCFTLHATVAARNAEGR